MTPRLLTACATVLVLAAVLGGCGDDDDPAASETSTESVSDSSTTREAGRSPEASVSIEMLADRFSPASTEVAAGGAVTVSLVNTSEFDHTFTVEGTDVDEELEPGARAEVELDVPTDGSLAFYCRFHAEIGMEGTVTAGPGSRPGPSGPSTTTVVTEPEQTGGYGY
jgi:plastocyanin